MEDKPGDPWSDFERYYLEIGRYLSVAGSIDDGILRFTLRRGVVSTSSSLANKSFDERIQLFRLSLPRASWMRYQSLSDSMKFVMCGTDLPIAQLPTILAGHHEWGPGGWWYRMPRNSPAPSPPLAAALGRGRRSRSSSGEVTWSSTTRSSLTASGRKVRQK